MKSDCYEAWKDFVDIQKEERKALANQVPWYLFHPGGRFRLLMDILGAVAILYDLFMIPVVLSFDDFVEPWLFALSTFTFWTVEIRDRNESKSGLASPNFFC